MSLVTTPSSSSPSAEQRDLLRFVDIPSRYHGNALMPWPCVQFDSHTQMHEYIKQTKMWDDEPVRKALARELVGHILRSNGNTRCKVVLLLGKQTPNGVHSIYGTCPSNDALSSLSRFVEHFDQMPGFHQVIEEIAELEHQIAPPSVPEPAVTAAVANSSAAAAAAVTTATDAATTGAATTTASATAEDNTTAAAEGRSTKIANGKKGSGQVGKGSSKTSANGMAGFHASESNEAYNTPLAKGSRVTRTTAALGSPGAKQQQQHVAKKQQPKREKRKKSNEETKPSSRSSSKKSSPPKKKAVKSQTDNKIPAFSTVCRLLKKAGFKLEGQPYHRVGIDPRNVSDIKKEKDIRAFRANLCEHGVCGVNLKSWNREEKLRVQQWVRTSIVESFVKETTALSSASAICLLMRLGFKYQLNSLGTEDCYFLPNTKRKDGILGFNMFRLKGSEGLFSYLGHVGLPDDCKFDKISKTERASLELYLAEEKEIETFSKWHRNINCMDTIKAQHTKLADIRDPTPSSARSRRRRIKRTLYCPETEDQKGKKKQKTAKATKMTSTRSASSDSPLKASSLATRLVSPHSCV